MGKRKTKDKTREAGEAVAEQARAARGRAVDPPMHIISLQAENVMRLVAARITPDPDGHLVPISGDNGAGKSAVLAAIEWALGGKGSIPGTPVRQGADRARIVLDLGDIVVRRTVTPSGGGALEVANKEGAVFKGPQGLLDRLTGDVAFDPMAFLGLRPGDQRAALQQLVGLDLSDLDTKKRKLLDARLLSRNAVAVDEARLAERPCYDGVPDDEIKTADLFAEMKEAEAQRALNDDARQKEANAAAALNALRRDEDVQTECIRTLERQLKQATMTRDATLEAILRQGQACDILKADLIVLVEPDIAAIQRGITEVDLVNQKVRANQERGRVVAALEETRAAVVNLRAKLATVDQERKDRLAGAEFPVPGLGFDENGVTFNDLPLEQAARSQQIRVAVAMGLAGRPRVRVLLVREGNDLDAEHVRLLAELAAEHDAQVWLERIEPDQPCSILIVDGTPAGQVPCAICGRAIERAGALFDEVPVSDETPEGIVHFCHECATKGPEGTEHEAEGESDA